MIKVIALLTVLALCGCQKFSESKAPKAVAPIIAPVVERPATTKADWQAAYQSVAQESQEKKDANGVTEFIACFDAIAKPCKLLAFGSFDAFKGNKFLTPASSELHKSAVFRYFHSYISLQDCRLPRLVFNAQFFSKNGWIFMNNVSILADQKKIFDHDFNHLDVKRNNESYGVEESSAWLASDAEISALRIISVAPTVIIRITGDKGFVTLDKETVIAVKEDAKQILTIYDKLTTALTGKLPLQCV